MRESQENQEKPTRQLDSWPNSTFAFHVFLALGRHCEQTVRDDIRYSMSITLASADHSLQFLIHPGSGFGGLGTEINQDKE